MTKAVEAHPEYWRENRLGNRVIDWDKVKIGRRGRGRQFTDADFAELVRRRTDGGMRVIDAMLEVMAGLTPLPVKVRNKKTGEVHLRLATGSPTAGDRVAAAKLLSDRGWGKPKETIEYKDTTEVGEGGFDLSRLSTDQVKAYLSILKTARGLPPAGSVVVDGETRPAGTSVVEE